jgi:hypothetical protein
LHQRGTQRLLLFWFRLLGVGVAAGKGLQRCVVEDGKADTHFFSSYHQQTGFKLPFRVRVVEFDPSYVVQS